MNGDDSSDLDVPPTATTQATSASGAGVYSIDLAGGSDLNYVIAHNPGQLDVTQAMLTVYADDALITYGSSIPSLSVSYSGFVNGDDAR